MELDDSGPLCTPSPPVGHVQPVDLVESRLALEDWPPRLVEDMTSHDVDCTNHIESACDLISGGIAVESDFSGCGGGDMALWSLIQHMVITYNLVNRCILYRSGDILPRCRQALKHSGWTSGPRHVTGNVLECLTKSARQHLVSMHDRAYTALASVPKCEQKQLL